MTDRYDAIVVGAGHNGLVCAALLGKAGRKVLVLEANSQVGGAAVTRSFADGYSVSACAHLLYQLQPEVRKDLGLQFALAADDIGTIALSADGKHVRYSGENVHGVSDADSKSYRDFHKRMSRFAALLRTYLNKAPPRLGTKDRKDLFTLAQLGLDVRRLGRKEMREFLREDGSIWVTIDDNEGHYLKVLMDEVFGRGNFVANVVWQSSDNSNNDAIGGRTTNNYQLSTNKGQLSLHCLIVQSLSL